MFLLNKTAKGLRVQKVSNVAKPILQTPGCHLRTPNYSSMSTKRPRSGWRTSPEPNWSKHEYWRYSARLNQPIIYLLVHKGFMKVEFCIKPFFIFCKQGRKARIMEHFQKRWEDYSTTEDYHLFIPPKHFQHLVLQRSPTSSVAVSQVIWITPLDLIEEASLNHRTIQHLML